MQNALQELLNDETKFSNLGILNRWIGVDFAHSIDWSAGYVCVPEMPLDLGPRKPVTLIEPVKFKMPFDLVKPDTRMPFDLVHPTIDQKIIKSLNQ